MLIAYRNSEWESLRLLGERAMAEAVGWVGGI